MGSALNPTWSLCNLKFLLPKPIPTVCLKCNLLCAQGMELWSKGALRTAMKVGDLAPLWFIQHLG